MNKEIRERLNKLDFNYRTELVEQLGKKAGFKLSDFACELSLQCNNSPDYNALVCAIYDNTVSTDNEISEILNKKKYQITAGLLMSNRYKEYELVNESNFIEHAISNELYTDMVICVANMNDEAAALLILCNANYRKAIQYCRNTNTVLSEKVLAFAVRLFFERQSAFINIIKSEYGIDCDTEYYYSCEFVELLELVKLNQASLHPIYAELLVKYADSINFSNYLINELKSNPIRRTNIKNNNNLSVVSNGSNGKSFEELLTEAVALSKFFTSKFKFQDARFYSLHTGEDLLKSTTISDIVKSTAAYATSVYYVVLATVVIIACLLTMTFPWWVTLFRN